MKSSWTLLVILLTCMDVLTMWLFDLTRLQASLIQLGLFAAGFVLLVLWVGIQALVDWIKTLK